MKPHDFYFCEDQSMYGFFKIILIAEWEKHKSLVDDLYLDAEILDILTEGFTNEGTCTFRFYMEGPCTEMCCRDDFTKYGKKLLINAGFVYSDEMHNIINK